MRAPSLLAVVYFTLLVITLVALPEGAVRAQGAAEVGFEKKIQTALAEAGFEPGVADGKLGPTTRRAIQAWQRAKGYAATGALTIGQVEALLGSARSLAAYDTPGAQGLTVEQDAVYTVQAPTTDVTDSERLTVVAWVNHADSVYAVGEWVRLFVQANKDAYLTVLNVGASGQTTVLFPNAHQTEARVSANQIVEVPDPSSGASITVSGPTGWELIKVIGSTKPTSLFSARTAPAAGLFTTLQSNSRSVARDLQMTMQTQADQEWDDYNKIVQTIDRRTSAVIPLMPAPAGTAWPTPPFGLRIAASKSVYRMGEPVLLYARTTAPCFLTLVNIGSMGQARVLLPNAAQPQNLIPAGQTVVFPVAGSNLQLTPMGPPGMETVAAVCSSDNQPVFPAGLSYDRSGFAPAGREGVASRALAGVRKGRASNQSVGQAMVGFVVTQ